MNQRYAGFWIRVAATFIDVILLIIVYFIIGALISGLLGVILGDESNIIGVFTYLFAILLDIGYFVVYQQKYGQTIGKKALKIKVVTLEGKTPTMFAFFLREIIGKNLSAVILYIGYLMILWDAKKQGLHDKIANTYVAYVEQAAAAQQAVPTQQTPIEQQQPVTEPQQTV